MSLEIVIIVEVSYIIIIDEIQINHYMKICLLINLFFV